MIGTRKFYLLEKQIEGLDKIIKNKAQIPRYLEVLKHSQFYKKKQH